LGGGTFVLSPPPPPPQIQTFLYDNIYLNFGLDLKAHDGQPAHQAEPSMHVKTEYVRKLPSRRIHQNLDYDFSLSVRVEPVPYL
jgi:hypothetical protein